jgi:hypothetical protein
MPFSAFSNAKSKNLDKNSILKIRLIIIVG